MLIDGKKIAGEILAELAEKIKKMPKPPKLAAILVGDIPGSKKFLELKQKAAERIGIEYQILEFPEGISSEELQKEVVNLAASNDGVIVELPLPKKFDTQKILDAIPENKDPDVLSQKTQDKFFAGQSAILPPAAEALKIVFDSNNIEVKNKECAIFGQGFLVGKPIAHWLEDRGAAVVVIDEFTENPEELSRQADIIVSGVGKPNLIKPEMVKDGAIIIDFGYNNLDGKIVGDVDFQAVSKKVSRITPVPGGMGPIVIAAVLKNLLTLITND